MVTLDEASNIMYKLAGATPTIEPARCCKVRHKLSRCTYCIDACPTGAIQVVDNEICLDKTICRGCGACSVACPTQALTSKTSFKNFDSLIETSLNEGDLISTLWLCCSKHPLANLGSAHLETIPCCGSLDESQLIHLSSKGIQALHLLTNFCDKCPLNKAALHFKQSYQTACALMEKWGLDLELIQTQEADIDSTPFPYQGDGYSRRGFFTSIKDALQESSIAVAESTIEQHFEDQRQKLQWRDRLLNATGTGLAKFEIPRINAILDDLFALDKQPPESQYISTRFWGQAQIDYSLCSNCGLCSFFCPTAALKADTELNVGINKKNSTQEQIKKASTTNASNKKINAHLDSSSSAANVFISSHTYRACDCAQCHLCEDACPNHAIKITAELSIEKLFKLEPQSV